MSKGIYSIKNSITNERYIGSSVNVEARWLVHKAQLCQSCHHAPKLQAAWQKYDRTTFVFEVIEELVDNENRTLCEREQYWIDHYDSYRTGYNTTPIASRPYTLTDEERGLKAELIRYGLYEPRYIQQIKLQNPLQYDSKNQEKWQIEFDQINRLRRRYVLLGWICFITLLAIYFVIAIRLVPIMILLLPITFWPILLVSLWIGTARSNELSSLKAIEPKAIARHVQDALVKREKEKRRIVRMPRKGRRYW